MTYLKAAALVLCCNLLALARTIAFLEMWLRLGSFRDDSQINRIAFTGSTVLLASFFCWISLALYIHDCDFAYESETELLDGDYVEVKV